MVQVSTKLKVGVMWDHNGTYMEGYGLQYKDHQVVMELTPEDELAGAQRGTQMTDLRLRMLCAFLEPWTVQPLFCACLLPLQQSRQRASHFLPWDLDRTLCSHVLGPLNWPGILLGCYLLANA